MKCQAIRHHVLMRTPLTGRTYDLLFRHHWVDLQDKGAIEVMPFEACSDDSVLIIDLEPKRVPFAVRPKALFDRLLKAFGPFSLHRTHQLPFFLQCRSRQPQCCNRGAPLSKPADTTILFYLGSRSLRGCTVPTRYRRI